jgi:hypothetical protein
MVADYMMDFTGESLDDGRELVAVDEGEYTVQIKDWKSDDDGKIRLIDTNGNPYMMPILDIVNCEEAEYSKTFTHFLRLPNEDMTAKQRNNAKFQLATFFKAFGIDYSQPIDPESTIGLTADALLVMTPDEGYGEQNRVKRFIASH